MPVNSDAVPVRLLEAHDGGSCFANPNLVDSKAGEWSQVYLTKQLVLVNYG